MVRRVLDRLEDLAAREDPPAKARVRAREETLGARVWGRERADLYGGAPLAITREVGELLYALVIARGATSAVEFGASLGFSTIHLAAALRDLGGGRLVTTELDPEKARALAANLAEAELDDLVEVRVGDAMQTLRDLAGRIDFLFLDGWNDLYLPVLRLLEPKLSERALVLADLSADDPVQNEYVEEVRRRYLTVQLPLDAGVVISARLHALGPG